MSKNQPLVSIIMPAYNAGKYIEESVLSVLDQSYRNWELIIINDGSTDRTAQLIDNFLQQDNRIRLIDNQTNKGLVVTRNKGLEAAEGKYIANLDSDDVAYPDRLKKQVEFLEKNPQYVLLGAACWCIDDQGKKLEKVKRDIPNFRLRALLLYSNYFINSTTMFRSDSVKQIRYQDGYAPAEDYEFFSQLSQHGLIGNLEDCLVKYRIHDQNISSLKKEQQEKAIASIIENQLSRLGLSVLKEELQLHTNLVEGKYDMTSFPLVEKWLLKLIEANEEKRVYEDEAFNYFAAFFYRRACEQSHSGIKAVQMFKKSPLSKYIKNDLKGNSVFFVKSILKK